MKKPTSRDRGEYRPWFVSTIDDPAFAALDPFAFKLLFALRMTLSAIGIGILRPANVMDVLGCSAEDLERGLQLLEKRKPGSEVGWIMREGRIVWIINALHFLKGLYPNDPKHRVFVTRELASLSDCAIVRKFRDYYEEWLEGSSPEAKGQKRGIEAPSEHKTRQSKTRLDKPSTRARARESVPEQFQEDFDDLMRRVANEDAWASEISAAPAGMNGGRTKAPSLEQVGQAIRDYNANGEEPNLAHFRGYLRRSTAEPRGGSVRSQKNGRKDFEYTPTNSPEEIKWAK